MAESNEQLPNIYLERSGKGSREILEKLVEPPTFPLDEPEKQQVKDFEALLCEHLVSPTLTIETLLRTHKGEALESPAFFADAFLKGQVHSDGLEGVLRQFTTSEDLYTWLAQVARDQTIEPAVLRDLAKQSATHYITEASQALVRGTDIPPALMEHESIVLEPQNLLDTVAAEQQARRYVLARRKEYGQSSSDVDGAKRAFSDIYLKSINGVFATDMTILEHLARQSERIGDEVTADAAFDLLPKGFQNVIKYSDRQPALHKRLDYLQNGIGLDEEGHATGVDRAVIENNHAATTESETPPLFTPEQKQILVETMVQPDEMMDIFRSILAKGEKLSSEDSATWTPGRGHRAADNRYQVVFNPKKDNFAVNGIDGVFQIPKAARTMRDVLIVGIHELTHIDQNEIDQLFGKEFKIGEIKGRRVSAFREGGANISERQAEKDFFGASSPVGMSYAKAIQTFEAGGDMFDAAKAFYDEKRRAFPGESDLKWAKEAADRVMRLILSNNTNSQPMSYAEENIMNAELQGAPAELKARATLVTNIDFDDQERMHRYGLLPEIENQNVDWTKIMLEKMTPYIQKALGT